jgi:hypothetical protein
MDLASLETGRNGGGQKVNSVTAPEAHARVAEGNPLTRTAAARTSTRAALSTTNAVACIELNQANGQKGANKRHHDRHQNKPHQQPLWRWWLARRWCLDDFCGNARHVKAALEQTYPRTKYLSRFTWWPRSCAPRLCLYDDTEQI